VKEGDKVGLLSRVKAERANSRVEVRIGGTAKVSAAIVELDDLFERRELTVVKKAPSKVDIPQVRSSELPVILLCTGYRSAAKIVTLGADANIVKLIIRECGADVASVAVGTRAIENPTSPIRRRIERLDAGGVEIDRRTVRVQRTLERRYSHSNARGRYF